MTAPFWEKSYAPGVKWEQRFQPRPVTAILDEAVRKFRDRPMLDFMNKKLTYGEVGALVDRAAAGFQKLGVGPGVHVGLFLPNTPFYPIAFFGILKAGGIVVNYSPLDAERELRYKVEDSESDFLVTLSLNALYPTAAKLLQGSRLKKLIVCDLQDALPFPKNLLFALFKGKEIAKVPKDDRHLNYRALIDNDGRVTAHAVKDPVEEVALLQYTGGTTGQPKGAMLTHANLTTAVQMFDAWTGGDKPLLTEGHERCLVVLPMFHIYALTAVMLRNISGGTEMVLHPRFELHAVIKDLAEKKITVFPGVPTMFTAIVNHPSIGQYDLRSLKFCGSGGAPLPVEIQEKFEKLTGCRLSEGWGMTETAPAGTSHPVFQGAPIRKGSCGLPLPGITIEIVDVDDPVKVLAQGERGEICIKGPNVMKGYWKKPKDTKEAFLGGRFHTGDVGYLDTDGYVYIVDRKKDMILSGGFNVYPRNIEEAVYEHPSVAEVTVIGIPDDYRGQSAKAFIKLKDGAKAFTFDELKDFLKDKLGRHEQPAAMEIRDALPKTIIGKLSKKELVEEERKKYEARKAASPAAAG
jgi:long-chain acyl-CoA synthetase